MIFFIGKTKASCSRPGGGVGADEYKRSVGGFFAAADAPSLPMPYHIVAGGVSSAVAKHMHSAVTTAMKASKPSTSFPGEHATARHIYRYLHEWSTHSAARKHLQLIYAAVRPLARAFCVERGIATAARF